MSRKDSVVPAPGLIIKKVGDFDLDALYSDLHLFFEENSYIFHEKENTTKVKDKGNELEIRWTGERNVDTYARFIIDVYFYIERLKKVGKVYNGDLTIYLNASVELDYKNEWPLKPFGNFLFKVYNGYVIKQKIIDKYYGPLYGEITALQDRAKKILEFYP